MNFKKKALAVTLASVMSLSVCAPAFAAEGDTSIQVNGVKSDVAASLVNGKACIKADKVNEVLGIDGILNNGKYIVGNTILDVNTGDYLGIRDLAEAAGYMIGWDNENKTVVVVDVNKLGNESFDIIKKYVNKTDPKIPIYTTEQQYGILRNLLNLIGYRDMASMNYVYRNPADFAECIYRLVNTGRSPQNTEKVEYRDIICSRSAYKETEHVIDLFDTYNVTDVQRDEIFRFLVRLIDRGIENSKISDEYVKAYEQCDCGKAISALNDYFAKRRNTATGDEELADFLSAEMLNSNCTDRSDLTATLFYLISEISKSEYSNFLEKFTNDSGMRQLTTVIIFEMCGYMRYHKRILLTYKNGAFYRIKTADIFEHSAEVFDAPLYNIANAVDGKEKLSETQKQIYNDAVERFTKMNPAKQNVVLEHIKAFVPSTSAICDLSYMDCYRTIRINEYDIANRVIFELIRSVHLNTTESYFPMIADCIKMSEKTEAVQNISDKGKPVNKQESNAKRYELYAKAYALVGINLTGTVEEKLKFTAEEWKVWALYECCIRSGQEELLKEVKKIAAKVIRDNQREEEKQENAKQTRKKHSKEKNIE